MLRFIYITKTATRHMFYANENSLGTFANYDKGLHVILYTHSHDFESYENNRSLSRINALSVRINSEIYNINISCSFTHFL